MPFIDRAVAERLYGCWVLNCSKWTYDSGTGAKSELEMSNLGGVAIIAGIKATEAWMSSLAGVKTERGRNQGT